MLESVRYRWNRKEKIYSRVGTLALTQQWRTVLHKKVSKLSLAENIKRYNIICNRPISSRVLQQP